MLLILSVIAAVSQTVTLQVTTAPAVNAGGALSIILPVDSVMLTGVVSKGTGGPVVSTAWTQSSGPNSAVIATPNQLTTRIGGLIAGTYVFRLSAWDSIGNLNSDSSVVTVYTANGNAVNVRLYAGSNPYKNSLWNNWNVGSGVVNNTNSGILKYSNGSPSGISALLSYQDAMADNGATYTKNAAMCPDTVLRYTSYTSSSRTLTIQGLSNSAKYNIELYASRQRTDGQKTVFAIGSQSVTILTDNNSANAAKFSNVSPSGGQIVITINKAVNYSYLNGFKLSAIVNSAPVVTAGANQSIQLPESSVTLTGSAVPAAGNTISSYSWTQISGPATYTIVTPNAAATTVTGLVQGVYVFQLTATDNAGASGSATVQVTVAAPVQVPLVPPVVKASADQTISLPVSSVTLSQTNDSNILSYTWSKVYSPGQPKKSIGVIGSSTSSSTGLPTWDSGYVRRMQKYYTGLGLIDTVYNIAIPGYNVYQGMPAGYIPPANRSLPAPEDNITTILAKPNIGTVIVNFPSNGYDSIPIREVLFCLRTIYNTAVAAGKACFITTSQPRPAFDAAAEDSLLIIKDSVLAEFGSHAINFYDGMVDPGTKTTQAIYAQPDGVHFNSLGHERLFEKVIAANMVGSFGSSPAVIASPTAGSTVVTGLTKGIHKFQVAVVNSALLSGSSITKVTVNASSLPPTVNAGIDQVVPFPGDSTVLQGQDSAGSSGIAATAWTQVSGPSQAVISAAGSLRTPVSGLAQGIYQLVLSVTDSLGTVVKDTVRVTVEGPRRPKVDAGSSQTIAFPATSVVLNGKDTVGSGPILSTHWRELSGPGIATIVTPDSLRSLVTGLVPGVYTFQLSVLDSLGFADSASTRVTLLPPAPPSLINVRIFGGDNPFRNLQWNNWNVGTGARTDMTSTAFKYADGTVSPVTAVLSAQDNISDNGSPYRPTATMCPDTVLRYDSYSSVARTLTISGLNNTHIYNLSLYASRLRTDGQRTKFTIGTTTITILTDGNSSSPASFTNVAPSSGGSIVVTIANVTNYSYLNGFTIKDVTSGQSASVVPQSTNAVSMRFGQDIPDVLAIHVFPNPVRDHLTLVNPGRHVLKVQVFDINGRPVVNARILAYGRDVPMGGLARGYYIVVATDELTGVEFRKKILKL